MPSSQYSRELCDIDCALKHETKLSWLIVDANNNEVWIPKSIGEWEPSDNEVDGVITVPQWFAEKEGLV